MPTRRCILRLETLAVIVVFTFDVGQSAVLAQRQLEHLDRGIVAVPSSAGHMFVSWRLLADDPVGIAFHVYRSTDTAAPRRLTESRLNDVTCFVDEDPPTDTAAHYQVAAVVDGREQAMSKAAVASVQPYLPVPLQTLDGYRPNDASVGDLDGDGQYEIVLHQVGRGRDNSQSGFTTEPILEAYQLDGTFMWRINLGKNIREGAHYTQFMVYDLDGDGCAEVACKTADGTVDGKGTVIGDAEADYRSQTGRSLGKVLEGPEFLTIFEGRTGAALATTDYIPPRGDVADWGDDYGNRVDRFLACVAYLDGTRPSLVMCRGYYTRTVLAAWNWRDGILTRVWTFDSDDGTPGNRAYRGQGNHGIGVGDVDADGRDEIVYGSCVIDDDGSGLYSTGLGHGDAMHFTDHDPQRPGLEVFKANGDSQNPAGIQLRDARTGQQIWGIPSTGRKGVGRACAMDIDPRHAGSEAWGKGEGVGGLFNLKGERISDTAPRTCNMGVWWDGDLLRELLDGVRVSKWDWESSAERPLLDGRDFDCVSNNGSKSNPCLCADILGDWREEIVAATRDGKELRIFTTTIPTEHRLVTLTHDPVYRLSVAWQNVSYNQPAHPGFFLGDGMATPPRADIRTVRATADAPKPTAGIGAVRKAIPDKLVVLTFDDSSKSHFTVVRPLLKQYGFGATFFITEGFDFPDNKHDYMTWEEIAQLHKDGFEIGNHTRDHLGISDQTVGQLDEQLRGIEDRCREHGIPTPVTFAWPGNATTQEAFPILSAHGIRFARRGGAPEYPYEEGRGFAYEPGADHPLLLPSAGDARPDWTLDNLIRAVAQARDGKVAILQFHGAPDTAHSWVNTPQQNFAAFMRYLAVNDYQVVALRDLNEYVDADVKPTDPLEIVRKRKQLLGAAGAEKSLQPIGTPE